ncbi:MAG: ABC transporter permease [Acidobacteria bacterium]|nr:ABC transporter permease [Acidobacteriota bacterium]
MARRGPFTWLLLARLKEFVREPEVIFWVFGFPVLLAVALGIAFRNKPPDQVVVGVIEAEGAARIVESLGAAQGFEVVRLAGSDAAQRLRMGKVSLVVVPGDPLEYRFDPTRPESTLARRMVDDALQRAAGRQDAIAAKEVLVTEPGARYIDFLIPGLLWGVGFALVDMRTKKLLKRLVATPMRRRDFLGAMMASRGLFVVLEVALMLLLGWLLFGMVVRGSLAGITLLAVLGAFCFASIGLLVASRAKKIETVTGLINLVMLPMFVFSGIFFSSDRFPALLQPFIKALPLTALNDALRASILEGAALSDPAQLARIGIMALWGGLSFVLAMRWFRWAS